MAVYPCGEKAYQEYISRPVGMMVGKIDKKYEQLTSRISNRILREAMSSHAGKTVAYMVGAGAALVGSVAAAHIVNDGTPVFGGVVAATALTTAALHHAKDMKMVRCLVHASKSALKSVARDTREDRKKIAARISRFAKTSVNKAGHEARELINSDCRIKQIAGLALGSVALALKKGGSSR